MNVFDLVARIGLDTREYEDGLSEASRNGESFAAKLKNGFGVAAKVGGAAIAATATAVAALTKSAVEAYANYEQLVGGVETLFKDNADQVQMYAANAYQTAGLSANAYMETVTSFSASLLQSLGGDTAKAAEYADLAITDMSDNANKMGTDMESIQYAYQGFAKQNYTMLDNLKLGYGGTKEEMERLIADANKLREAQGLSADLTIDSYADVVTAIHAVQTEMGITGTTAAEASTTIEGSVNTMKSAWSNLVVGLADDNADFDTLLNNFIDSVVTVGDNLVPRIETTIKGIGRLISSSSETLVPTIVGILVDNLPMLLEAGIQLVVQIAVGLIRAIPQLVGALPEIIMAILNGLSTLGSELLNLGQKAVEAMGDGVKSAAKNALTWGKDLLQNFIDGITSKWSALKQKVSDVAQSIKDFLGFSEPEKGPLSNFHTYAPDMMQLFAKGIADNEHLITDQIGKSFDFGTSIVDITKTTGTVSTDTALANEIKGLRNDVKNLKIYLSTGALVGGVTDGIDHALGQKTVANSKRRLAASYG